MKLCGIDINCCTRKQLFASSYSFIHVVTVNAEAIVMAHQNSRLKTIIDNSCSTIDGQVPLWLYKIRYKTEKIEKISGSDIIYDVCKWAKINQRKVFLLGGNSDSNEKAISCLHKEYQIDIDGFSPYYESYPFSKSNNDIILSKVRSFAPHVLFVGFGMGKQEFWIDDNKEILNDLGVKMVIGCGGTFDFVSGRVVRAPKLVQNIGMEGLWRLFQEPKLFRLKRIMTSLRIFFYFFQ